MLITAIQKNVWLRKQVLTVALCRHNSGTSGAKHHTVIKKFQPSIEKKGAIVEETVDKPMHGMLDVLRHQKKAKQHAPQEKVLTWFDKKMLVALGKFNTVEEVPDKLRYKQADYEALTKEKKSLVQESGFKYMMGANYIMTILSLCLLAAVYTLHSKFTSEVDLKSENNT